MRKWISTAIILICTASVFAEDVVLSDKRVFIGATIFPADKDGFVIISGKDERGTDYVARVQPYLLPEYIRKRMGIEKTDKTEIPHDAIELGKLDVVEMHRDANEVVYSWKIAVRNTTPDPLRLKLKFVMFDECMFPVAEGDPKNEVIGAFKSEEFSGMASVKPALARKASFKRVQVVW